MVNFRLIAPLVYFYDEDHAADPSDNLPDDVDLGYDFHLIKIDKAQLVAPLIEHHSASKIISDYHKELILSFSSHAIIRDYQIEDSEASDPARAGELLETKRLLGLLRMAFGLAKRSHMVFQDFHVKDGEDHPSFCTALNLEGSYWDANSYYPVETDVSFDKNDMAKVREYFKGVVEISGDYSRVFNACYYFETARRSTDYRMQFTLFVTSLESIFNTKAAQISETLALRYSVMMRDDPQERLT